MARPPVPQSHWSPEQPSPEELTLFTTLSAYADALDALPLDLTRSFSDLRELDAVLGAHLNSLTNRLIHLTALVEDSSFSAGERILALKEVAEEARAYKMGGEDKIRVALNTAETVSGKRKMNSGM
jgi:inhibitor of growth protein 3